MTRMINRYSPILKPEISLLLPIPIAPPRKSILPVKAPIPAPRSSLESYKQSETAQNFGPNERQKYNEEKNNDVGSKSKESGPKWTVQKGESGRSLKWTVARKWTVCPKVDGLEPNRTVI